MEGEDCCELCPDEGELEGEELDPEEGEELDPDWRCCCTMFCTFCSFFSWLASCCWRSLFTCVGDSERAIVTAAGMKCKQNHPSCTHTCWQVTTPSHSTAM